MRAGELRQRVTVQARTQQSDGHDGFVESWAPVRARISALVRPLLGRDLESARQIDPRVSHDVTLRYWRNYQAELAGGRARIVYHDVADRTFDIVAPPIDLEERHVRLRVLCREAA